MNAANEVAVAAFLAGKIGFYDIPRCIAHAMERISFIGNPSLDDIFSTHSEATALSQSFLGV